MAVEVILPKVDMDMATGTISKWHVKEGETVHKGAVLFEIETDKAAMEIGSPGDGIIRHISALEGAVVPVGSAVAYIYGEGEAVTQASVATMPIGPANAPTAMAAHRATAVTLLRDKVRATPLARRVARSGSIALEGIIGSGPRGRIVAADVEHAIAAAKAGPVLVQPPVAAAEAIRALYVPGSFDSLPVDGMRRAIAERLTLSKQTVPHFYLTVTCDVGRLVQVRERLNALAPRDAGKAPKWKLSVNDFIIKAMALALQQLPAANVTWAGDSILQHKRSDVGVAVAVEGGLFTPVIRAAEAKTLSHISREMKDFAERARARKLAPSEYQGGATAISNLGMYGIEQFTAIINPPQATILAVGAVTERFVPVNGQPVLKSQMVCTLSCDHRAIDGALGAQLLAAFRSLIEEPALMLA